MTDQVNNPAAQLPAIQASMPQASSAAPLEVNTNPNVGAVPQTGVVQEAVAVLMNTNLSPYQMASQFATVKENYLSRTYGITIE